MIGLEAGHRLPADRRALALQDGTLLLVAVGEILLRLLVLFLGRAGLGRERGDDLHVRRRPLGHEPVQLGQQFPQPIGAEEFSHDIVGPACRAGLLVKG